jgi:rubredoxin
METEARGDKIIQGTCGYAYSYPEEDQPQQTEGREAEDQDDRHQQAAQLVSEEPPDEVGPDSPSNNEGTEFEQLPAEKYRQHPEDQLKEREQRLRFAQHSIGHNIDS